MRAASVLQAAWAGTTRRLVQSLVVLAVLGVSSAAAVTGLTLAYAANAGYTAGIAATHGANLAVIINAAKVTAAQLAATRHLPGMTQDAGPYPQTTIIVGPAGGQGNFARAKLTVVGRGSPSGPLDDIVANPSVIDSLTHGQSRWPTRPGEISLSISSIIRVPLGAKLTVVTAPGRPSLTVTGYGDVGVNPENAWVVAGAVAGTILGNSWVLPVIGMYAIQGSHVSVPLWINLTASLGMLALTGLAATVPAVRAGRLRAITAITAGQAPRAGRGALAYRLAARLRLPETVTTGLAAPFSRPARSAVTLAALLFGLTGVVLGTSLNASIHKINHSATTGLGQLQTEFRGLSSAFNPSQAATAQAAIRAQPGTLHYVGETDLQYFPGPPGPGSPASKVNVGVPGRPDLPLMTYAYNGDSSWLGWSLIGGQWYDGPGQVDVSTVFAADTHHGTGDSVTLTVDGKPLTVRIAGEVFVPTPVPAIWVSSQTLGGAVAGLAVHQYDIDLTPGTSTQGYTSALQRTLQQALGPDIIVGTEGASSIAGFLDTSLFAWLTVLTGVLAGLGVLNAALLATRERVHDLGVFKAVGMTPRQAITMVICWVIAPAVIAAAIALPAGLITQDHLVRQLTSHTALHGTALPASFVQALGGVGLLLLAVAGLAIAVAGALGPAAWAARTRTSAVLHIESSELSSSVSRGSQ